MKRKFNLPLKEEFLQSAVMGSRRLPFPSRVFDIVHCARCRVPWHAEGGLLLLELNRVLRPGGYFVWSATPVYQKLQEDVEIWKGRTRKIHSIQTKFQEYVKLTCSWFCSDVVPDRIHVLGARDHQKGQIEFHGAAIFRKPTSNECYDKRQDSSPPMCKNSDDPNAAW